MSRCFLILTTLLVNISEAKDLSQMSLEKDPLISRQKQILIKTEPGLVESTLLNSKTPTQASDKEVKAELNGDEDRVFNIREHKTNYAIKGDPDTKIQFSYKFKLIKDYDLFLGYTQVMFWDLDKESKPFSDVNYNPELYYTFKVNNSFFKNLHLGYEHNSNGKAGLDSRSYDSAFLRLIGFENVGYGLPKLEIKLRTLHRLDETNEDIRSFYGPFTIKLFFNNLGKKIFRSEQLYLEYYAGDKFSDIVDRSSFRLSCRFKIFKTKTAPKIFIQYFNGYGENLANYNVKTKTFRVGFSIGGE